MADVLSLLVDTVEQRITQDRLLCFRTGENWDRRTLSNIFIEPETQTAMLMPLPFTPTWQASASGLYHRLNKNEYAMTTPTKWTNHDLKFAGDTYLQGAEVSEELVQTLEAYDKNQPVFISLFGFNDGNSVHKILECGWGTWSATPGEIDLALRIWSNGNVEVWRGSVFIGNMKIVTRDKNKQTPANASDQGAPVSQVANDRLDLCAIPFKHRDLLLVTNFGSDVLTFESMDEAKTDNVIARAGQFWWRVPSGTAQVQFAPLRYATSGTMLSNAYQFRQAPVAAAAADFRTWHDSPAGSGGVVSLTEADGVTAFVADGTKDTIRVKVALSGTGAVTPFYYGSVATFEPTVANTVNDPTTITDYALSASLNVGEGPADTKLNLVLNEPVALATAGMSKAEIVSNRPFEAKIGTITIFSGRTNTPKKNFRISDEATQLTIECQDRWKALEKYVIRTGHPLDDMGLTDTLKYLATMPGYAIADTDVEQLDLTIQPEGHCSKGDWTALMQAGDTPAKWLLDLQEAYFADSVMGWVPTATGPKFKVGMIDTLNAGNIVRSLYTSRADAATASVPDADIYKVLIRSFNEERFEIEANEVAVTWQDPKTYVTNIVQDFDRDSQDPELAVALRPDNWVGEPRIYARGEQRLVNNPEKAEWCARRWMKLLSEQTRVAEWDCEFLIKTDGAPVWRGDIVAIMGTNPTGLYRITTLKADFKLEDSGRVWRPAHYTAVYVGEVPED